MKVVRAKNRVLTENEQRDGKCRKKEEERRREKNLKGEKWNKKHSKVLRGWITC